MIFNNKKQNIAVAVVSFSYFLGVWCLCGNVCVMNCTNNGGLDSILCCCAGDHERNQFLSVSALQYHRQNATKMDQNSIFEIVWMFNWLFALWCDLSLKKEFEKSCTWFENVNNVCNLDEKWLSVDWCLLSTYFCITVTIPLNYNHILVTWRYVCLTFQLTHCWLHQLTHVCWCVTLAVLWVPI